jgi:Gluconate 2-dehydrogenase subunit 3
MPINRRTALKQVVLIAGGTLFLPACAHHSNKSTLALHHLWLPEDQQNTLEALADALLPAGTSPTDKTAGAKATGAYLFALKMMDDCYPENQQQQYMRGLQAFDQLAQTQYGKSFATCDQTQRNTLVANLDASAFGKNDPQDDLHYFYRENKRLVVHGYLGSQYFLTKIEVYELVPGRWHGCVPVTKKS